MEEFQGSDSARKPKKSHIYLKRIIFSVVAIAVVLGILYGLLFVATPTAKYLYKSNQCGHDAIIAKEVTLGFTSRDYYVPDTPEFDAFFPNKIVRSDIFTTELEFFCTAEEAEQHQYREFNFIRIRDINKQVEEGSDPSLCENITTLVSRDLCYDKAAFNAKDPTICDSISTGRSVLPTRLRDDCRAKIAIETNNSETCNLIEDNNARLDCLVTLLPPEESSLLCDEYAGELTGIRCWLTKAYYLKDYTVCDALVADKDKLLDPYTYVNDCRIQVQYYLDNKDSCNVTTDIEQRTSCYKNRATEELNPFLCDRIGTNYESYDVTNTCYAETIPLFVDNAIKTGNIVQACNSEKVWGRNWQSRVDCFIDAAKKLKDGSLCSEVGTNPDPFGNITNSNMDKCYREVAKFLGDGALCSKINDEYWRGVCVRSVE